MAMVLTALTIPTKIGVAPGTTTFTVNDGGMCDRGAMATVQKMRFFPTLWRDLVENIQTAAAAIAPAIIPPSVNTMNTIPQAPGGPTAPRKLTNYSPYATLEELRGVRGFFARLRARLGRRSPVGGLGYILNVGPTSNGQPTSEIVATMKNYGPGSYCGTYDASYHTRGTPGYYYDSPMGGALGAIPSDLQLSRIRGYTPVMSSWVPFQNQTWAPAPWVPPNGTWSPDGIRPVGPRISRLQLGGFGEEVAPAVVDPAQQAVDELKKHQDRTFALTVVSTMAIASTAVINILKHLEDAHKKKKRDLEPGSVIAPLSGARRRRRRR